MKLLIIMTLLATSGCSYVASKTGYTFNEYEVVQVGHYTCIGMVGKADSSRGGLWCERTTWEGK